MSAAQNITGGLDRRKTSKFWYGRFQVDGKRKVKNLFVEIRGTPPSENEEYGSVQYERSRAEAEASLKSILAEINGNKTNEELAQAVHEVRTGRRVDSHDLEDLPRLWEKKPRGKPVSEGHRKRSVARINDFVEWMQTESPGTKRLDHLSANHTRAFMDWQEKRGINPRTWNFILATMKTACRCGKCTAFDDIPQKPLETVHRIPFTPEELQIVLTTAQSDGLVYPLVVTAACTAMRKGDCCRLRWKSVDLQSGFITVKTSKTGRTVDIPLADLLRAEIEKQFGNGSEYVFPELAKRYYSDDTYLTKRFKKILAQAGFHDGKVPPSKLDPYDQKELEEKAETYFNGIPTDQKRDKARAVFAHYTAGKRLCDSADLAGVSKSTASAYLNEVEAETGTAFIRGKNRKTKALPPSRGDVRLERETGLRKASVRDFHALRTTWITLALMQGMPLELVQTVTGHATAKIVMQHYFKPQREQLKTAMQNCLPGLLTNTAEPFTPAERAAEVLRQINANNWKKRTHEALKILEEEIK